MNNIAKLPEGMQDITNLPATTRDIPLSAGGHVKGIIPQNVEEAYRMAQLIVKSGLAPSHLKSPEAVLTTILHGAEIGLPPMFALSKIAVINGRPSIWGDAVPALIRASGLARYIKETIEGEGDKMVATCSTHRKGEEFPVTETYSASDALTAGLWGKAGTWKNYPKRMLKMRARAALRDTYADVLGGLYIREELDDGAPDDYAAPRITDAPPPPPAPTLIETPPPAPVEEPETVDHAAILADAIQKFGQALTHEDVSNLDDEFASMLDGMDDWAAYNKALDDARARIG